MLQLEATTTELPEPLGHLGPCCGADARTFALDDPCSDWASRHEDLGPFLVPLTRQWLSRRWGYISVEPWTPEAGVPPSGAAATSSSSSSPFDAPCSPSRDLLVWPLGPQGRGAEPVGRVCLEEDPKYSHRKEREVITEVLNVDKGKYWWLSKTRSRVRRVCWDADSGQEVDVWDCIFLDTVRKAARWVEQLSLNAHLEEGLRNLAGLDVVTTEAPKGLTVALCISTMNRLWQLRRALVLNLLHCWPHRKWAKIYVVDFQSTDGTMDFLLRRCQPAIECGLLRVYQSDEAVPWHASICKNTAHVVASEDIYVNVDSDNLVGKDFAVNVAQLFADGWNVLHYEDGEGTCGRIACWKKDFHYIRGYDEDAYPMGAQDVDLLERLKSLGDNKSRFRKAKPAQAIINTREAKVACCSVPGGPMSWGRMDSANRYIFKLRRDAGQLKRNMEKDHIGVKVSLVAPRSEAGA